MDAHDGKYYSAGVGRVAALLALWVICLGAQEKVERWPGIRRGPNVAGRDMEVATASREPWVDANSYLVAYLRAVHPQGPAVLDYGPKPMPPETLELALVETEAAGGRAILSQQPPEETARFLREHAEWFHQPNPSRVAVAAGTLPESGELLNLMFRRNLCPVVLDASKLPALDPARYRVVVAANIAVPAGANRDRLLQYARAGGLVVTAGREVWWGDQKWAGQKTRSQADRDFFSLGKGQIVAYHAPIADPSEFALDVIDLMGVPRRDLRLWNAPAVVGLLAGRFVHLINYGVPIREEFPARVEGVFQKATLHEPGTQPRPLRVAKRGSATEITVDRLNRLAVISLE